MAFIVTILAALAMVGPLNAYKLPSTGSGELAKDFQQLLDVIPLDELLDISRAYRDQDAQFQAMLKLATSSESKKLLLDVEAADIIKEMLAYTQANGLDAYYMMNKLNEAFQLPPYKPLAASTRQITGGLEGYVKDIFAILPHDEINDIVRKMWECSKAFSGLVQFHLSIEFQNFYRSTIQSESCQKLMEEAEGFGVDRSDFVTYYTMFWVLVPIYSNTF